MTNDLLQELMGGAPTCSFDGQPPLTHEGKILRYEKNQQRDLDTNELLFWEDGSPRWQFIFTLETAERDPDIKGDNGARRLFAKARMLNAIRGAIRESGHEGDIVGGTLSVTWVSSDPPKKKGFSGQKNFEATFSPPLETDDFGDPDDHEEDPF